MKTNGNLILISVCIVLVLLCSIMVAGCVSGAGSAKSTTLSASQTEVSVSTSQTLVQAPPIVVTTTSNSVPTTTARLSNGVMITYPTNWEKEELSSLALRDYGTTSMNIANFYSPTITVQWMKDSNPDPSPYTTMSIDVDPNPVSDSDRYFNLATVALQKEYGSIDITKHNVMASVSGYKAYELDFDTKDMRRSYFFTNVDGIFYIFTVKNPTPYSADIDEMLKSIKIVSPVSTQKHR